MKTSHYSFLFCLIFVTSSWGQQNTDTLQQKHKHPLKLKSLILPTALLGYGVIGIESDQLKVFNADIKEELNEHIDDKFTVDDFSQYSPFVSVFVMDAFGVKANHDFKNRTVILATAYLIMGGTVNTLKSITSIQRPDGSSRNSFPSGHTATAFMGAEFLYQEYKHKSIWYGVFGYAVAAGTGYFRMYNDRHWLTDVAGGAGIGILSTKLAYWIHPWLSKQLFNSNSLKERNTSGMLMPFYNGEQYGLAFHVTF